MPKPETSQIMLNGKPHEVGESVELLTLLDELGINPRFLVVEWNEEPVRRENFGATVIQPGDRLELVRPVAGG